VRTSYINQNLATIPTAYMFGDALLGEGFARRHPLRGEGKNVGEVVSWGAQKMQVYITGTRSGRDSDVQT